MDTTDLLKLYRADPLVKTIADKIKADKEHHIQLKGLSGSMDAIMLASVYKATHKCQLVVLHDKEEAAYFQSDLENLLKDNEVLFFPASYKRIYEFNETENANVLMRAEVLGRVNGKSAPPVIVTYPEALVEKVINKKSLKKNTLRVSVGDRIDMAFFSELLLSYDFEKTEFVYEAGQFAIRGGILDVFSYAHELPYRIELFGDEVESIRTFEPGSQLSVDKTREIDLVPDIQTKLIAEERQGFLEFLPDHTKVWFKDLQHTLDVIDTYFAKATERFGALSGEGGKSPVALSPGKLFETSGTVRQQLASLTLVEFGNRYSTKNATPFHLESEPQPSFNKNFDLLVQHVVENQAGGHATFISSDSPKQLERLQNIFEEIDPLASFGHLNANLRGGFKDKNLKIACYTDHELFGRYHRYKSRAQHSKSKALTLKELRTLQVGDFVAHIDHGIGKFAGMEKQELNGTIQESVRLVYRDDDLLYVSVHSLHKISKYTGKEGTLPPISKLGSPEWENKKKKAKKQVKDIAKDLISLYAKRKKAPGFAFSADSFLQAELESSFIYDDTPDQAKASADVKEDMEQAHPMDRLVCGDVGFGKTEIAIRAAFKAVDNSKQVAVLVPTTILAMQHYRTFSERLSDLPVKVEYINRFRTPAAIKQTLQRVQEGETDILIGTHRIVGKDVHFKNLGLMIIDEEQKFGVKVKEKLKEFRVGVDALTLTATPIPRTLHFSLMGARDLSIISTPPPNRQPVTTEIHTFNEEVVRNAVSFELQRGGQVFFVHNRIGNIEEIADIILRLVPDAQVGIAHGQMEGQRLEKAMMKFIHKEYDVLVSTNIIESGLDIPNANTIIINRAHTFGLSDLHQMRGRVGRSNQKAFCYLLTPPTVNLSADSRKRLSTMEEFTELGDGFKVAMRDLDIRGAGNLLGSEQSGFISDLGFDMYHKILDEAVQELKETEFKDLFVKELAETAKAPTTECNIETDLELVIPDTYVSNTSERLSLYSTLDRLKNDAELERFIQSLADRFGPLPEPVSDLAETVRLRWLAEQLGFEKLTLKSEKMKGYFVSGNHEDFFKSDTFGRILSRVQQQPKRFRLREYKSKLILTVNEVLSVQEAKAALNGMASTP